LFCSVQLSCSIIIPFSLVGIEDMLHKFTTFINADAPDPSEMSPEEAEEMEENLPIEERNKLACTIEQGGYKVRNRPLQES